MKPRWILIPITLLFAVFSIVNKADVSTAGRDFEVLFRVYGPEKPFFDKTWKLPDSERVK
jgi:hypothetical protein